MTDLSRAAWRKSSRSNNTGGACVEVAFIDPDVAVRDSKNPTGAALAFSAGQWVEFQQGVKAGRYDLI